MFGNCFEGVVSTCSDPSYHGRREEDTGRLPVLAPPLDLALNISVLNWSAERVFATPMEVQLSLATAEDVNESRFLTTALHRVYERLEATFSEHLKKAENARSDAEKADFPLPEHYSGPSLPEWAVTAATADPGVRLMFEEPVEVSDWAGAGPRMRGNLYLIYFERDHNMVYKDRNGVVEREAVEPLPHHTLLFQQETTTDDACSDDMDSDAADSDGVSSLWAEVVPDHRGFQLEDDDWSFEPPTDGYTRMEDGERYSRDEAMELADRHKRQKNRMLTANEIRFLRESSESGDKRPSAVAHTKWAVCREFIDGIISYVFSQSHLRPISSISTHLSMYTSRRISGVSRAYVMSQCVV